MSKQADAQEGDGFPPRGSGNVRRDTGPRGNWGHPWELGPSWDMAPGKVLLGEWQGRELGRADERHIVTVAGSRAGKSHTVLKPNLRSYPGSMLVLDPKGELAHDTAADRRKLGQAVYILDPFGISGEKSASYNPFEEIRRAKHIVPDAALFAEALIIGNEREPYWTDSARQLIQGISLYLLATHNATPTIAMLRKLLHGTLKERDNLYLAMERCDTYGNAIPFVGQSFVGKARDTEKELQSILSTAQVQTAPLDDMMDISEKSDFRLTDLKTSKMTVYLVLPGMRMGTHFRWLRLILQQALAKMEETDVKPEFPVLFVLEEFAALGHMRSLEAAAGFMAGFGVKLWTVLQDFTQLKTHYPKSWETFLGNAGIIQAFGNIDMTTTEYLSKMLGRTLVYETQNVQVSGSTMAQGDLGRREHLHHVPLLDPNEIAFYFAANTRRQLIVTPGRPPIYMNRFSKPAPMTHRHQGSPS